jgi:hypothetical protein
MSPVLDTEIKELRDLTISLREEIRVGFANNDTKLADIKNEIQRVEAKSDIKFIELKAEITAEIKRVESKTDIKLAELVGKIDVIDERTKLSFWGFIDRTLIIAALILLISFSIKYFFFGTVKL